jgi:phage antirepressor YoqD-like protein
MQQLIKNGVITSLELVDQINIFRREDGNKNDLAHSDLLKIIRHEFRVRIGQGKISETQYIHPQNGQAYPMFELTLSQAKQVLIRESETVREVVLAYIEKLENELLNPKPKSDIEILADAMQIAQRVIANKDEEIKKLAPKAEYTDKVLQSNTTMTITDVAKDLGITANRLNEFLCEQKVQTKHRDHYVLLAKHQGKGYERMTTQMIVRNNEAFTKMQLEWTERGRAFIHFLYNQKLSFSKNPLLSIQGSIHLGKY